MHDACCVCWPITVGSGYSPDFHQVPFHSLPRSLGIFFAMCECLWCFWGFRCFCDGCKFMLQCVACLSPPSLSLSFSPSLSHGGSASSSLSRTYIPRVPAASFSSCPHVTCATSPGHQRREVQDGQLQLQQSGIRWSHRSGHATVRQTCRWQVLYSSKSNLVLVDARRAN